MAYGFFKAGALTLAACAVGIAAAVGCGDGSSGTANAKLPEGTR